MTDNYEVRARKYNDCTKEEVLFESMSYDACLTYIERVKGDEKHKHDTLFIVSNYF